MLRVQLSYPLVHASRFTFYVVEGLVRTLGNTAPDSTTAHSLSQWQACRGGKILFLASVIPTYDPIEHPVIGFNYHINDVSRRAQWWSCGLDFPRHFDPSTWGSVELIE